MDDGFDNHEFLENKASDTIAFQQDLAAVGEYSEQAIITLQRSVPQVEVVHSVKDPPFLRKKMGMLFLNSFTYSKHRVMAACMQPGESIAQHLVQRV